VLGRGHASDVYLAQSLRGGAGTVALKLLGSPDSRERRAFLEVARKQARVAHLNVARVLDVGEGEVAYVAMEYVEGCTLKALLADLFGRDEPLPLPQTINIVGAVCRALGAVRPLVHGALKPSNVLIGRHNAVKLADLGAPAAPGDRFAPEQYAGKPPDRRSDVYAVGLLLHALTTGRAVDAGGAAGDDGRWPPLPAPSTIRPTLPPSLDAVVAKATRFGPRGRYATAGELLNALHDAAAGAASAASSAWLGDWVDRARRSS
jgi:serine/threonine-protein kinase